eukprot:CAMPEP_0194218142 /NCGR_PEP_ID=MMETSP0156-20130528/23101_1 /TAXON_ID=33649 /ORGANISM="Thalassionema nitzschioides, Strain L26-B" /LENGTH=432 /DNA_ID=CAMNT_0038947393 /DNA_START=11 /DNA_END=1309 /DNA_ORIENTATION=+
MMKSEISDTSGKDVDELLLALEASVTNDSFLKANDEDIAKELFNTEQQSEELAQSACVDSSVNDSKSKMGSMKRLDPLPICELHGDTDFTNSLAREFSFQHNSAKLDNFLSHKNHSEFCNDGDDILGNLVEKDDIYGEMFDERPQNEGMTGKRKRTFQRRSSLPSMHLQYYEDPFEPTPIFSHQDHESGIHHPEYNSGPPSKLAAVQGLDDKMEEVFPVRGRAPRRSSLPGMHLSSPVPEMNVCNESGFIGNDSRAFGVGRAQRRGSTGSYYRPVHDSMCNHSERSNVTSLHESNFTPAQAQGFEMSECDRSTSSLVIPEEGEMNDDEVDPNPTMEKLRSLMKGSAKTQKSLQQWDKDNGLPKSHSQTMVNTSRSRKQLQDGVILPKWDGSPLISGTSELGKPKPRNKNAKKEGGKIKRRMSAPATSSYILN